jgi:copper(I)-binding protein
MDWGEKVAIRMNPIFRNMEALPFSVKARSMERTFVWFSWTRFDLTSKPTPTTVANASTRAEHSGVEMNEDIFFVNTNSKRKKTLLNVDSPKTTTCTVTIVQARLRSAVGLLVKIAARDHIALTDARCAVALNEK